MESLKQKKVNQHNENASATITKEQFLKQNGISESGKLYK